MQLISSFSRSQHLKTQFFSTDSKAVGRLKHCTPEEGAKPITEISQQDQVIMEKHEMKPGYCSALQIKLFTWTSFNPDYVTLLRQLSLPPKKRTEVTTFDLKLPN